MVAPVRRSARIAAKQRAKDRALNHLAPVATTITEPRKPHRVRDRSSKGPRHTKNSLKVSKCHKRKRSESEPEDQADSAVKKRKLGNSSAPNGTETQKEIDPEEQNNGPELRDGDFSDKEKLGKKRKRSITGEGNGSQHEREQSPPLQPPPRAAVVLEQPVPMTSIPSAALDKESIPQSAAAQNTTFASFPIEGQKALEEIFSLVFITRLARQKRSEEEKLRPKAREARMFVHMLTRDYEDLLQGADVATGDHGLLQATKALRERRDNLARGTQRWEDEAAGLVNEFNALREQYRERRDRFSSVGGISKNDPAWRFALENAEFWSAVEDLRKRTETQSTMAATVASLEEERARTTRWIDGYCRQRLPPSLRQASQEDPVYAYSDDLINEALRACGLLDFRLVTANENFKSAGYAKEDSLDRLVVSAESLFVNAKLIEAAGRPENIDKPDSIPSGIYGCDDDDETTASETISAQQPEVVAETTPQRSREQIKQELHEARAEWREIREKFDAEEYRRLTAEDTADLKQPVCEDDEGAALVRKVTERTGSYKRAQERFLTILHEAQDAGIEPRDGPGDIQRDHPDDGWHNGEEEVLIAAAQPVVERWFLRNEAVPQPKRSCPSASSRPTLKSLSLGEDIFEKRYSIWAERIAELERTRNQLREDGPFEPAENDFHPRNLKANDEPPFDETGQMPTNIAELHSISGNTKNDQMRGQEMHERLNQTIDDDEEL